MVFSSLTFLMLFLPSVLLIYFAVPRQGKNAVLFIFSLLFYAWGEPIYVGLMIFSTVLDYTCGWLVEKYRGTSKQKIGLLISVFTNLSLLFFFKYTDFFIGTINTVFGTDIWPRIFTSPRASILDIFSVTTATSPMSASALVGMGLARSVCLNIVREKMINNTDKIKKIMVCI